MEVNVLEKCDRDFIINTLLDDCPYHSYNGLQAILSGEPQQNVNVDRAQPVPQVPLCGIKVQYRPKLVEEYDSADDADNVDQEFRAHRQKSSDASLPQPAETQEQKIALLYNSDQKLPDNMQYIVDNLKCGHKVLVIIRGLPGSGKSYLANLLVQNAIGSEYPKNKFVFSNHDYLAHNLLKNKVNPNVAHTYIEVRSIIAMTCGVSPVIIDDNNLQLEDINLYIKMALSNGYLIEILETCTAWRFDVDELLKRTSHNMSKQEVRHMFLNYDRILTTEFLYAKYKEIGQTEPQQRDYPPTKSDNGQFIDQLELKELHNEAITNFSIENLKNYNERALMEEEEMALDYIKGFFKKLISEEFGIPLQIQNDKKHKTRHIRQLIIRQLITSKDIDKPRIFLDRVMVRYIQTAMKKYSLMRVSGPEIANLFNNMVAVWYADPDLELRLYLKKEASSGDEEEDEKNCNSYNYYQKFKGNAFKTSRTVRVQSFRSGTTSYSDYYSDAPEIIRSWLFKSAERAHRRKMDYYSNAPDLIGSWLFKSAERAYRRKMDYYSNAPELIGPWLFKSAEREERRKMDYYSGVPELIGSWLFESAEPVQSSAMPLYSPEPEQSSAMCLYSAQPMLIRPTDFYSPKPALLRPSDIGFSKPVLLSPSYFLSPEPEENSAMLSCLSEQVLSKEMPKESPDPEQRIAALSTNLKRKKSIEVDFIHLNDNVYESELDNTFSSSEDSGCNQNTSSGSSIGIVKVNKSEIDLLQMEEQLKLVQNIQAQDDCDAKSKSNESEVESVLSFNEWICPGGAVELESFTKPRCSSPLLEVKLPKEASKVSETLQSQQRPLFSLSSTLAVEKKPAMIYNLDQISWVESSYPEKQQEEARQSSSIFFKAPVPKANKATYTDPADLNKILLGSNSGLRVIECVSRNINPGATPSNEWESPVGKLLLHKGTMTKTTTIFTNQAFNMEECNEELGREEELRRKFPQLKSQVVLDVYHNLCCNDFDWTCNYLENFLREDARDCPLTNNLGIGRSAADKPKVSKGVTVAREPSKNAARKVTRVNRRRNIILSDDVLALKNELECAFDYKREERYPNKTVHPKRLRNEEVFGNQAAAGYSTKAPEPEMSNAKRCQNCSECDNLPRPKRLARRSNAQFCREAREEPMSRNSDEVGEEKIELRLGYDCIKELEKMFGPTNSRNSYDLFPVVQIPKAMAFQLYKLWIDSMKQQDNALNEQLKKMIATDEEYAKSLLLEEEKPVQTKNLVEPNLKEIMKMELAMASYKNISSLGDMKMKVTKDMLHEMFPNCDKDGLYQIFLMNDGDMDATVKVIEQNSENRNNLSMAEIVKKRKAYIDFINKQSCPEEKKPLDDFAYLSEACAWPEGRSSEEEIRSTAPFTDAYQYPESSLDMHHLTSSEAKYALDKFINKMLDSMKKGDRKPILIITGRGYHSRKGQSVLKPLVAKELNRRNIFFTESNPGMLRAILCK